MTAAWCITCLVNEQAALSSAAVKAAFADRNIAYLKGDWTNRNPEITRVLEKHGRSGVPLYLLYAGGGEPIVLPQILTPAIVLGEIDRISEPASAQGLPLNRKGVTSHAALQQTQRCWLAGGAGTAMVLALGLTCAPGTADPAAQARIGAPAPGLHAHRQQRQDRLARRLQGQDGGAGVDQPRLPVRAQALRRQPMQALQKKWTGAGRGVADPHLLGAGHAGLRDGRPRPTSSPPTATRRRRAVLFDPKGTVGRAYGAQTTPHMYVITGDGTLVFMGGIDDKADHAAGRPEDREELRRAGARAR